MLSVFRTFFALLVLSQPSESGVSLGPDHLRFQSSYEQWKDPENRFVVYLDADDQARVVFIGSEAFARDGDGQQPTVSEGMGYGLLLAYAYDDQQLFDKFLRYCLAAIDSYGCELMPWIVNASGKPFWFKTGPSSPQCYYSSGSATDADIQIAWAVYLADQRVQSGAWFPQMFTNSHGRLTYGEIFAAMARAIRLHDVDAATLRYTPGSQWGSAGTNLLYPGYLTPQAFLALDTAAPPDLSSNIPSDVSLHSPENSLLLTFKNNTSAVLSIDYLGGNGSFSLSPHFLARPDAPNSFTLAPATTAVATFSSPNEYYANATLKATLHDEQGHPTLKSDYFFEYKNGAWKAHDQGSSPESRVCLRDNVAFVFLTASDAHNLLFKFADVAERSAQAVARFQAAHETGLFPNVLYGDGAYPHDGWSEVYGFDASRLPLWVGAYLARRDDATLQSLLDALLSDRGVNGFIRDGTLPDEGVDALSGQAVGDWSLAPPALNGPLYLAAKLTGREALARELEEPLFAYKIVDHRPSPDDPEGYSGPYFNAALLLLTRAFVEGRL